MKSNLLLFLGSLVVVGGCTGELADKGGWAALQSVEFHDRSGSSNGTEVRRLGATGLVALAVQGRGEMESGPVDGVQPRRSWILLNEHAADHRVKQMPVFASYDLRCSDIVRVEQQVPDIDFYAVDYLKSICTP